MEAGMLSSTTTPGPRTQPESEDRLVVYNIHGPCFPRTLATGICLNSFQRTHDLLALTSSAFGHLSVSPAKSRLPVRPNEKRGCPSQLTDRPGLHLGSTRHSTGVFSSYTIQLRLRLSTTQLFRPVRLLFTVALTSAGVSRCKRATSQSWEACVIVEHYRAEHHDGSMVWALSEAGIAVCR